MPSLGKTLLAELQAIMMGWRAVRQRENGLYEMVVRQQRSLHTVHLT